MHKHVHRNVQMCVYRHAVNAYIFYFFSSAQWKAWRRTHTSTSTPEADVIDGVEAIAPPARWPLLAQMVRDLTNRGHCESGGRLQGSRSAWVVWISTAGQNYKEMLLLRLFLQINISGKGLDQVGKTTNIFRCLIVQSAPSFTCLIRVPAWRHLHVN